MNLLNRDIMLAAGMLLFIPADYVFNTYLTNIYIMLYIPIFMREYVTEFDFKEAYSFLFLQSILFTVFRLLKESNLITSGTYTFLIIIPIFVWLLYRGSVNDE